MSLKILNIHELLFEKSPKCHTNKSEGYAAVSEVFSLNEGDEDGLVEAIAEHGVVTVLINADGFQNYAGGIFDGEECSSYSLDKNHAVVLTGYDSDYYILRNSWADTWGEQGYMKLKSKLVFLYSLFSKEHKLILRLNLGGINACGVANYVNYVKIKILK